ncbi:MAG TPA: IS3 family transposase [Desulfobacterales bacterium]|nr:IS3 family transposase [Desulfobacterales bacterium]HIP38993.1 IS3 family transposase [Desulfocapsa sulfexigens]
MTRVAAGTEFFPYDHDCNRQNHCNEDQCCGPGPWFRTSVITLRVSESCYYSWCTCGPFQRKRDDIKLEIVISAARKRTREMCGPKRLQQDIVEHEGLQIGVCRIKRLRKELCIRCHQKRKFKATTNSNNSLPVVRNLVDQKFTVIAPNQIWLTDRTYIRTREGWLYLAAHKDLFNGEIVGYALDKRMTSILVMRSFFKAVARKRPPVGLIHHSDRESQYCSRKFRKLIKEFKMKASMSRRGNCYNNDPGAC